MTPHSYAALPDDGKVIVIELILPETPETSAAVRCIMQIDLVMMTKILVERSVPSKTLSLWQEEPNLRVLNLSVLYEIIVSWNSVNEYILCQCYFITRRTLFNYTLRD